MTSFYWCMLFADLNNEQYNLTRHNSLNYGDPDSRVLTKTVG